MSFQVLHQELENLNGAVVRQCRAQPDALRGYLYYSRVDETTGATLHCRRIDCTNADDNCEEVLFDPLLIGVQIGVDTHSTDLEHVSIWVTSFA